MREFATHKDGKPRFYQLDNGHLLIIDAQGYHEFCATCKRLTFEYLGNGMHTVQACACPAMTVDQLIGHFLQAMDTCPDVESVKRMLLTWKARKDMSHVS